MSIAGRLTTAHEAVHPEVGRQHLFLLERVPGSSGYSQLRRPVDEKTDFKSIFNDRHLPERVAEGSLRYEQLVEDLARAGRSCGRD